MVGRPALIAALLLLVGVAPAGAITFEQVIQRHLDWLAKTNNYYAEIWIKGAAQPLGTVFVDNTKTPREVDFQGSLPINGRPRELVIQGTRSNSRATLDRTRATQWSLPEGPFRQSFDLFARGVPLKETCDRIKTISSDVQVLENPVGGRVGVKMQIAPGFLGQMDALLDRMLLGASIPRDIDSTIWFDGNGRLARMVLQDGKPDMVVATLKYKETNVAAVRRAAIVPRMDLGRAKMYPNLIDLMKSVVTEEGAVNPN